MPKLTALDRSFEEGVDKLIFALTNLVDRSFPSAKRKIPGWQEFLLVLMHVCKANYGAIKYLAADSPKDVDRKLEYSMSISPLNRLLADLLFTLIFIRDKPRVRCTWYHKAGWRELQEALERIKEIRGGKPEWEAAIKRQELKQEYLTRTFRITSKQRGNPRLIEYWPIPSQILKRNDMAKRTKLFLQYFYNWFYKDLSQDAHGSGGGIIRIYSKLLLERDQGREAVLKKLKYNSFLTATALVLAVSTEINDIGKFNRRERLGYFWQVLSAEFPDGKELFEKRYKNLLKRSLA